MSYSQSTAAQELLGGNPIATDRHKWILELLCWQPLTWCDPEFIAMCTHTMSGAVVRTGAKDVVFVIALFPELAPAIEELAKLDMEL